LTNQPKEEYILPFSIFQPVLFKQAPKQFFVLEEVAISQIYPLKFLRKTMKIKHNINLFEDF